MLTSIQTQSATIQLIPNEILKNPSLQIFRADSMSLIIGPNGSGKSRLLSEIVDKILSIDTAIEGEDNPYSKTLAIYYTPVPYHVDMPGECSQFIDLQHRTKPSKTQRSDFSVLQNVAKFFDFPTQLIMSFNSFAPILRDIHPFFVKKGIASSDNNSEELKNAINSAGVAQLEAAKYRKENKLDYLKYIDTKVYENIQNVGGELDKKIEQHVLSLLGDYPSAKLLALLEATKLHNSKFDIIQAVLEHHGLTFERKLRRVPKTALQT